MLVISVCRETDLFISFVYFLVGCHASTAGFHLGDVIWAHLACPLNDVIFAYIGTKQFMYQ
jgi:hypothetical protein